MQSILFQIGPTVPDHLTMKVQPGRMITAVALFTEFMGLWHEQEESRVKGDWGEARFVESVSSRDRIRIQLSEPLSDKDHQVDETHHIGLRVRDPQLTAHLIINYLNDQGLTTSTAEKLPGGKWWVEIPAIFATPIEFVPI